MTGPAWIFLAAALLGWTCVVVLSLGDVNLAERLRRADERNERQAMRNRLLLDQLDAQIEETHLARERVAELEAEALPVLPNWDGFAVPRYSFDGQPLIFHAMTTASAS